MDNIKPIDARWCDLICFVSLPTLIENIKLPMDAGTKIKPVCSALAPHLVCT